jgi:hypothetical protein
MDSKRRTLLASGAAATAMAAAPQAFAQAKPAGQAGTKFLEKGGVRIHYRETGSA